MCLWGAGFCKGWRRAEASAALAFGDALVEEGDEVAYARPRHGFRGVLRTSPVTGRPERYYPPWRRQLSYAASLLVTAAMLSVAGLWHIVSLNLQGYIRFDKAWEEPFFYPQIAKLADAGALFDPRAPARLFSRRASRLPRRNQAAYGGLIALVPTVIHVVMVLVMNEVYKAVAAELTKRENHVTDKGHEDALLVKRFVFEACDA